MKATCSSERSVGIQQTIRRYTTKGRNLVGFEVLTAVVMNLKLGCLHPVACIRSGSGVSV
jgi:hypothetical protein